MYSPAPGIICRRARLSDYEAVLAIIPDLYSGMDYIPARYNRYLSEPERLLYVMEKDTKIVAFAMRFFVDGGETGVGQAGRMLPELQGKGLMNHLTDYVDQDSRKQFPQMKRTAWTSINKPITDVLVKKYPSVKLVVTRPRITFNINSEKLKNLSLQPTSDRFNKISTLDPRYVTRTLTPSEAVNMLSNIPDITSFVPEERLIVDWEPFRPNLSNYNYIAKHSTVFVTYEGNNPKAVTTFSFGTNVRVKAGVRHRIDFYCDKHGNNSSTVLAHIRKHIILISQQKFTDEINMSMLLPTDLDQSPIRHALVEELGLGPLVTQANLVNDALLVEKTEDAQSKL